VSKGIPVLPGGDPVRRTFVIAGNYRQFRNWCMYSRVNPRSRMVCWLHRPDQVFGVQDIDLVYTGTRPDGPPGLWTKIYRQVDCLQALGEIATVYRQYKSADIRPSVVGRSEEPARRSGRLTPDEAVAMIDEAIRDHGERA
jgi:hypothetical protein